MEETKEQTETAAHCALGPSTMPARAVCPCHESAGGGTDAQSGTRSHRVVEVTIRQYPNPEGMYMPGTTADEAARGRWGAAEIMRLRDETAPGAPIFTETRTRYRDGGKDALGVRAALADKFGTVDAFWDDEDTLYIADYKTYATGDGEKSYLPQGMMYAALLASEHRPYRAAAFFVVAGGDRTVVRHDFTLESAKRETAATIHRVAAAIHGGLFRSADEARTKCGRPSAWCRTCAHAATCPAISRAVEMVEGGGILTKPLAVRMAAVTVLESFIRRVKADVKAVLDSGGRVRDEMSGIEYALAERAGRARLADLRGLAESVLAYGVEPADFAAAVTVSKSAVDGLLKAADEREGRKAKKSEREAAYLPFFTKPGTEKYVKRIS